MTIPTVLLLIVVLFSAGILAAVYLLYHKLSFAIDRISKQNDKLADNTISQIESLLALYAELNPIHGLLPTRGWVASPDFLRYLTQFAIERKPKVVVECSSGMSTLVLAASLKRQGHGKVFSLEHDPLFAEKTRQLIDQHELTDWARVIDAPLTSVEVEGWSGDWYDTSGLPADISIDMLVVDGPPADTAPMARFPALPRFAPFMSSTGIVVLDDAVRSDEQQIVERWQKNYGDYHTLSYLKAEKGIVVLAR